MAKISYPSVPAQAGAIEIHAALTGHRRAIDEHPQRVSAPEPLLLTATEAARLLGMSVRQFHKLRPQLPAPVVLGPRHVRWRRADMCDWVAALDAESSARPEPTQLRAGKVRKNPGVGGPVAETIACTAESEHLCGSRRSVSPSNSPRP